MIFKINEKRELQIYSNGKFVNFRGSEIGLCVKVIHERLWGRVLLNNRPRSEDWWKRLLHHFIYKTPDATFTIDWTPGIYDEHGTPIEPPSIFEKEMSLDEDLSEHWLEWLQKIFKNIDEDNRNK